MTTGAAASGGEIPGTGSRTGQRESSAKAAEKKGTAASAPSKTRRAAGPAEMPRRLLTLEEVRSRLQARATAGGVPLATILTVAAVAALLYLAGKFFYTIRDILFLVLFASIIAVLVDPIVVALERRVRRRGIAVLIVTITTMICLAALVTLFGYPLVTGLTHFAETLPRYVQGAQRGHGWVGHLVRKYHVVKWVQKNVPKIESFAKGLATPALRVGEGAALLVLDLGLVFMLVLLLLLEAPKMRRALVDALPPERAEHLKRVGNEVSASLVGYLVGDLITSAVAGTVMFVTLTLLHVPYPVLWAVWVALVDMLPEVGGALAGIPTVLFAVAHSLVAGVVTAAVFLAYTQLENRILNPVIMSKTVRLNPLVIFVAVLIAADFGAWIGGPFGGLVAAFLAIPLAGALQIVARDLWTTSRTVAADRPPSP
jgi:predicted PurR-regulated permease PerM